MLKKVGHILLILILLVFTMGMTVDMHFCKHKLYDIGIFSEVESCCLAKEDSHRHKAHQCDVNNHHKNDCEDEIVHIDKVDNFVVSSFDFNFENQPLSLLFASYSIIDDLNIFPDIRKIEFYDLNNSPPGTHDILSLIHTYLI